MKKQICSLALSALFGLGVAVAVPQAQDPLAQGSQPVERHQPDPNRQIKMLSKRLNLTADQQNQILPILTDRDQQVANILADSSLAPKDRHAKMRAVREDSNNRIKAVLNDNQKQAFDQMQQEMRQREQERREQRQNPTQS